MNKNARLILLNSLKSAFLVITSIFTIIGCHDTNEQDEQRTVFRYNESSGITSLDPAYASNQANIWAVNQLFNGLVQLSDQLEIEPSIAKNWEISGDGLKYTFFLRNDVSFHDDDLFPSDIGRKVVANDFVYSFNRIGDPEIASPGSWILNHVKQTDGVFLFHAPNDSTFSIELKQPFTPFLGLLTMQYCSVVPVEAITNYGKDFREHPVGTGPFRFKYWKEGVKLVFLKNENYFETEGASQLPYLDAVAITFLIDKQSAFLEFVKGNIDFMSGIDASYKDEVLTREGQLNPKYENKFNLISQPYLNVEYLAMMVDSAILEDPDNPFLNKDFRKAINYGFDRIKMMRYLRNNIGIPGLYGMIPPGMPSFDPDQEYIYYYKPDTARLLLSQAGYPNGEGLPEITLATTSEYLDLCKYIQHQLSELGVAINIDVNPPATLKELKAQAKLPFFRASWIADYPDEENYLSLFYSTNFCPSGPNYTHFQNDEYDLLYHKALRETNDSVRYGYYIEMNHLVMEESPVVILYYDQVLRFVQKNIYGLGSNPINLLTLKRVKKKN